MSDFLDLHPALLAGLSGIGIILLGIVISDMRGVRDKEKSPSEAERLKMYGGIRLRLALMAVISVSAWGLAGLPLAQLGLQWGSGWRIFAAWSVVFVVLAAMTMQTGLAIRTAERRRTTARAMNDDESLAVLRPVTSREIWSFAGVGLTAGVTEEIIFRGFLSAVFALILPLWTAIILANALFVFAHIYQGWKGMLRIVPVTILMAFVASLGESLYPAIVLHIGVDLIATIMFCAIANEQPHWEHAPNEAPAEA